MFELQCLYILLFSAQGMNPLSPHKVEKLLSSFMYKLHLVKDSAFLVHRPNVLTWTMFGTRS